MYGRGNRAEEILIRQTASFVHLKKELSSGNKSFLKTF